MAVLEAEWRRRERQREAEAASARAEYAALEDKARQVGAQLLAAAVDRPPRITSGRGRPAWSLLTGWPRRPPQVVAAAEERERRLVAAEEALARRRREAEREHAARAAEAEAAVRRLQVRRQRLPALGVGERGARRAARMA
jgi:centrosomal protein CEP120